MEGAVGAPGFLTTAIYSLAGLLPSGALVLHVHSSLSFHQNLTRAKVILALGSCIISVISMRVIICVDQSYPVYNRL